MRSVRGNKVQKETGKSRHVSAFNVFQKEVCSRTHVLSVRFRSGCLLQELVPNSVVSTFSDEYAIWVEGLG